MNLDRDEALRRLVAHDHAVLATVHPDRGADAVPVCFAVAADHLVVPVDVVKPKRTTALQRRANLDLDPRATLLVDHWDPTDWSRLWWVRAQLRLVGPDLAVGIVDELTTLLRAKYEPYRATPFADLLVFEIVGTTGWAAAG